MWSKCCIAEQTSFRHCCAASSHMMLISESFARAQRNSMSSRLSPAVAARLSVAATGLDIPALIEHRSTTTLDMAALHALVCGSGPIDLAACDAECARLVAACTRIDEDWRALLVSDGKRVRSNIAAAAAWTGRGETVMSCFDAIASPPHVEPSLSNFEASLVLCTVIDRAPRDVFVHGAGGEVPAPLLIRDVLASAVLHASLSAATIHVLQLLIGPPTTINIRNLLWHGFVAPHELPRWVGPVLLLVLASLLPGPLQGLVQHRPLRVLEQHGIMQRNITLAPLDEAEMHRVVERSSFPHMPVRAAWHHALCRFSASPVSAMLVLLPLVEDGLRQARRRFCALMFADAFQVFAAANDCAARVMTAEATELFTTLEIVLELQVDATPNRLFAVLPRWLSALLLDLFVFPEVAPLHAPTPCNAPQGPRLRDRASHGEVDNLEPWPPLVLRLALALCEHFADPPSTPAARDISSVGAALMRVRC